MNLFPFLVLIIAVIVAYWNVRYYKTLKHNVFTYFPEKTGSSMMVKCIDLAKKEILIKDMDIIRHFANSEVIDALKMALELKAKVYIIGPLEDIHSTDIHKLILSFPDQIEIKEDLTKEMPIFMVVDKKYLFLEDRKRGVAGRTEQTLVSAYLSAFEDMWAQANT